MSESLRCVKSSPRNQVGQGPAHHNTMPYKFSSIFSKVESLINKMNHDKQQQNRHKLMNGLEDDDKHKMDKIVQSTAINEAPIEYPQCSECETENQLKRNNSNSLDSLNNFSEPESAYNENYENGINSNHDSSINNNNNNSNNSNNNNNNNNANNNNNNNINCINERLSNHDIYTDSDDAEIAHITGTTSAQVHRHFELDQLTDETIREFNEQCSSLSHDSDFYNSWQNEDELEKLQQQRLQITKNNMNEECNSYHGHNDACNKHNTVEEDTEKHVDNVKDSLQYEDLMKDNNNNNQCLYDRATQEWSDKFDSDSIDEQSAIDLMTGKLPLSSIQQIVNNITQSTNKSSPAATTTATTTATTITTIAVSSQLQNNLCSNGVLNVSKARRSSVASSGSVGRMETILEEPTECKISVKEILARFETMTKSETQIKPTTTLSSGVRAAAQTLNVPIERLESRQSNHREPNNNTSSHTLRNASPLMANIAFEEQQQHHFQQQYRDRDHHSRNLLSDSMDHHLHHNHFNGHSSNDDDDHIIVNRLESSSQEQGLLFTDQQQQQQSQQQQQKQQLQQQHQYPKQMSYLHTGRKVLSNQQQQHAAAGHLRDNPNSNSAANLNQSIGDDHGSGDGGGSGGGNGSGGTTSPSVTRYSLLQFAMQHFRNDRESNERSSNRHYADLVKWQDSPIHAPLLRLPNDLAPLALECFDCILRYCSDIPMEPELSEVKCVYTVLMHCHKYLALRDEVYCQLMKQTTANRSSCPDSAQRGWRLLSILAAYFGCSDALRPYLVEHLTSAASDRRRSCHGTAAVCLTNLRKTARCGGRKNVPSVEEVTAVSAGRSARRQIYRLPGGAERVVNTRCSTVVADVISELCALLGIESEVEQQEFSLYCIVQGDAFTMPLAADEYILDVTTELLKSGQPFYLIFCRSVWHFSLKRDPAPTPLYVEVLFNQVAPDYLEGLLLELPSNGVPMPEVVRDMARIAALLHRAADLSHVPAMKEIKFLLPKPALGVREIRPAQWVGLVQSVWPQIVNLSPGQVKAQFLNVLSAWPLFGSSFFAVKRIWAEEAPHIDENHIWRDLILALNRRGVLFLDPNTHETLQHWPFMEVISTRKVRSENGALFLDMKVGNLMQQRVIRVQTEQAHEISRLVRQYITMAQISQRDK